jgi:ribonuclease T1
MAKQIVARRCAGVSLDIMLRTRRPLLVLLALLVLLGAGYAIKAINDGGGSGSSSSPIQYSQLPSQAQHTVQLIRSGGPFPYSEDGEIYYNREKQLPHEVDGYYHSYTVVTPGESDRGARRIITGKNGEFYYTTDHYQTFRRVDLQ